MEAEVSLSAVPGLVPSPLRMAEEVNEEVSANAHFSEPQAAVTGSSLVHALGVPGCP